MPRKPLKFVLGGTLVLLSAGCLNRVPVTFQVTDASTGAPIASAYVSAVTLTKDFDHDLLMIATGQTGKAEGRTGTDGRLTLNVPSGRLPIHIYVQADGYGFAYPGYPPHWAQSVTTRPVVREVVLYPRQVGKSSSRPTE
jgi:hypothetical protein